MNRHSYRKERQRDRERVFAKLVEYLRTATIKRETKRRRYRQTDRQKDRVTKRQTDRKAERQRDKETKRQRDKETERQRDICQF
jgi:hypothetical protein